MKIDSPQAILFAGFCVLAPVTEGTAQAADSAFNADLRNGTYHLGKMAERIPGFVEFDMGPDACAYTVYLEDPETQEARARAVFAPLRDRCQTDSYLDVVKSYMSLASLERTFPRLLELLRGAGEREHGVGVHGGRIYVEAINPRHRDRVAALLRRASATLPADSIEIRLGEPPYALDPPVTPPDWVYHSIAGSLPPGALISTVRLPPSAVGVFRSHGFRVIVDPCLKERPVWFHEPEGFDDNRYLLRVENLPAGVPVTDRFRRSGPHFEFECREGTCALGRVSYLEEQPTGVFECGPNPG